MVLTVLLLVEEYNDLLRRDFENAGYVVVDIFSLNSFHSQNVVSIRWDILAVFVEQLDNTLLTNIGEFATRYPCPVVVFTSGQVPEIESPDVQSAITSIEVNGYDPSRIKQVFDAAEQQFKQVVQQRNENSNAERMSHLKITESATSLLARKKGLSWDQAYQTLRSMALRRNKSVDEVAEELMQIGRMFHQ